MTAKSQKQRSIRLSDAPEFFAPKAIVARRDAARGNALILPERSASSDSAEIMKDILEIVGAGIDHLRSRQEPVWEMRRHLAERLATGKLVALGYRTKPSVSISPESVPAAMFSDPAAIVWHESAVEAAGQRFELVTVARPDKVVMQIAMSTAPEISSSKSRPGRPSKIEIIDQIIDDLYRRGVPLNSQPRGVARALIIEEAIKTERSKSEEGFSAPVIQRALYRKFGRRD